jgi:hypothetical protein
MPSESSTPNPGHANVTSSGARAPVAAAERASRAAKGAATLQRHKEERRADSLGHIRAQIADGTLVVRQMTVTQHRAAIEAADKAHARNEARVKASKAPPKRDP